MRRHACKSASPHCPAVAQITLSSVKHCLSLSEIDCLLLCNSRVKVLLCIIVLQEHPFPFLRHLQLLSNFWWEWLATHLYGMRFPASYLWYILLSHSVHFNFCCLFFITGILRVLGTRLAFDIADGFCCLQFWRQVYWSHLITDIETLLSVCTFLILCVNNLMCLFKALAFLWSTF